MLHGGLPARAPLWDFPSRSNTSNRVLHSTCGALAASLPQTGAHCTDFSVRAMPHRPAAATARHGIDACRLAAQLRGAMIAATPSGAARREPLLRPERGEPLVD